MPDGYDSHADYMDWVREEAEDRYGEVNAALVDAFAEFIEIREIEVINFSTMNAHNLARAIESFPVILKPILACCNIAARAIERDLGLRNLDTYATKLDSGEAKVIAGYVKPFLPRELPVPTLSEIDRHFFVDKQIRAIKGRWEKKVIESLNKQSGVKFKKRHFVCDGESFELDGASPVSGDIQVAVDVKRIEARRDIHKRCDEIVNKASKFKKAYPNGLFAAVLYYPFTAEHVNVRQRIESSNIDSVVFASQSQDQLDTAIGLMLDKLGIRR